MTPPLDAAAAATLLGVSKRVPSFGLYVVTVDGRVWSDTSQRWLRPCRVGAGYLFVNLYRVGAKAQCYVHRLVAEAFVPNPQNLPQVNHMDGDKTNNAVGNLEWCSASHNCTHSWRTGLNHSSEVHRASCSANGKKLRLLTDPQVRAIRALRFEGLTHRAIAEQFGIRRELVRNLLLGRSYADVA